MTSRAKLLSFLIAVGLSLRLAPALRHGFAFERVATADSQEYLDLSERLRRLGTFTASDEPTNSLHNPWPYEVFRTPGYPLLLAFLDSRAASLAPLILLQVLFGGAIVALTFCLANLWFDQQTAAFAGLLMAIDPAHVIYANLVMSDIPFAFAVAAAFLSAADTAARPRLATALTAGLFICMATAIRPIAGLLGIPLSAYVLVAENGTSIANTRRRLIAGALLLVSLLFGVAWSVRNERLTGYPGLSNAYSYNAQIVASSKVEARARDLSLETVSQHRLEAAAAALNRLGPQHWGAAMRDASGDVFRRYPLATTIESISALAEMSFGGERRYLLNLLDLGTPEARTTGLADAGRQLHRLTAFLDRTSAIELLFLITQLMLNLTVWVYFSVGLYRLVRQRRWSLVFLVVATLVYFYAASIVVATGRMRIPFTFLLAIVAAAGMTRRHPEGQGF